MTVKLVLEYEALIILIVLLPKKITGIGILDLLFKKFFFEENVRIQM